MLRNMTIYLGCWYPALTDPRDGSFAVKTWWLDWGVGLGGLRVIWRREVLKVTISALGTFFIVILGIVMGYHWLVESYVRRRWWFRKMTGLYHGKVFPKHGKFEFNSEGERYTYWKSYISNFLWRKSKFIPEVGLRSFSFLKRNLLGKSHAWLSLN